MCQILNNFCEPRFEIKKKNIFFAYFDVTLRKTAYKKRVISPLFLNRFLKTKYQINRLDKRNKIKQVTVKYIENLSFFVILP